ncbi:MAG: transcriptional regulator, Crp/Fnr family [Candidatus Electronema aureum]|uniref:Transcriptional regulator, Crp/Fnr family n=1 Tax=Candidatus Electronema aureum TaxID=2005002 RepID=A0A521G2G0_9BACT|nr:MAG: transcriptional regulator, Crp/Fnr family [Candidatus Electronema aureum]
MENKIKLLAESLLFNGLPESMLQQLAAVTTERQFNRSEAVFFEGQAAAGFYLIKSGQVKIFKLSPEGKEQILHVFGRGEPFGEVPVFSGQLTFPANAVSLSASELLFFPKQDFVRLITASPDLALSMLAVLSRRLCRFAAQIESLSLKEVPSRVAAHLVYLAETQGSTKQVELDIPKGQLASLLGTSPETLSRIFNSMSAEGLIRVEGRRIELLRYEGLITRQD